MRRKGGRQTNDTKRKGRLIIPEASSCGQLHMDELNKNITAGSECGGGGGLFSKGPCL